jgi:uncharacterized protein YbjT (DUF2867 family)
MILIAGATGTNGREVVIRLSKAGHKVRALVRNPAKADGLRLPNVELVQGDLDNPVSLDAALVGVERAFIVTAVDQRGVGWFRNFFEAAKRAGTPHVVKYSGSRGRPPQDHGAVSFGGGTRTAPQDVGK